MDPAQDQDLPVSLCPLRRRIWHGDAHLLSVRPAGFSGHHPRPLPGTAQLIHKVTQAAAERRRYEYGERYRNADTGSRISSAELTDALIKSIAVKTDIDTGHITQDVYRALRDASAQAVLQSAAFYFLESQIRLQPETQKSADFVPVMDTLRRLAKKSFLCIFMERISAML